MQFYLVDDDPAILQMLRIILEDSGCGGVCGSAASGVDALEDLNYVRPDIVLLDLVMPGMDGIEFVRRAGERHPELRFIMLSQITAKDRIAEAYDAGVDFYISKPVNRVEVVNVVQRVEKLLILERIVEQMRPLVQSEIQRPDGAGGGAGRHPNPLSSALHRLGISGDPASRDITLVVEYLAACGAGEEQATVAQLCERFSDSPKAMEQRIRRAAVAGMINLANIGIEDYTNDTFNEYAGTLYHFEQVRREMDCIRGKINTHGRVSVKQFLYALASLCSEK